jgi:hypothetical protein
VISWIDFEGKTPESFHNVCAPFESFAMGSYATHPFHLVLVAANADASQGRQNPARRPRIHQPVLLDDRRPAAAASSPEVVKASLALHALQAVVSAKVGGQYTFNIFAVQADQADDGCAFRILVEVDSEPDRADLAVQDQSVELMRQMLATQFEYQTMDLCGWTVHVQNRLMCDVAKSQPALDLLRCDFQSE